MRDFFDDSSFKSNNLVNVKSVSKAEQDYPAQSQPQPIPTPTVMPMSPEAAGLFVVADIVKESIVCFTDYMKCREHEITERKRINACLKAVMHQIDANKEVYLKTMEMQFEERKQLYSLANGALELAKKNNDSEMMKLAFNYLLNIYQFSVEQNDATAKLMQMDNMKSIL